MICLAEMRLSVFVSILATAMPGFGADGPFKPTIPTGFVGYGVKTRAVKGHEFGLQLPAQDKKALIAFLRTL